MIKNKIPTTFQVFPAHSTLFYPGAQGIYQLFQTKIQLVGILDCTSAPLSRQALTLAPAIIQKCVMCLCASNG